jgi:hypothetical protein
MARNRFGDLPVIPFPMAHRCKPWLAPILVTAVDVTWGWLLTTYGRPWLFQMLGRTEPEASVFYDSVLEPRLWIGYAIVLALQLNWVNVIAPRALTHRKLRLLWWTGCAVIIVSSMLLRQGLTLAFGPSLLLLGVQIGDLLLLYWLATSLLTPLPQRRAIPCWW